MQVTLNKINRQGLQQRQVSSTGDIQPQSADWFDSFSHAESTFDDNGDGPTDSGPGGRHTRFVEGYTVNPDNVHAGWPRAADFFYESESAGSTEAWSGYHGKFEKPPWRLSGAGRYLQDYVVGDQHRSDASGPLTASWFDNTVLQSDEWERDRRPNPPLRWKQNSGRWYTLWQERAVNTSLTCSQPNCTGSILLQAYDPATEMAANCRLNFPVHPTDYDDLYSGERVEFINVNGHRVQTDCYPSQSSCDGVPMPMFNCLQEYPVDALLNTTTGQLLIEAKIPDVVDECPYNGNLLSAIPVVTCMVRPLPPPPPTAPPGAIQNACVESSFTLVSPMQCPTRGCAASTMLVVDNQKNLTSCSLTVTINQTDFDGEQGSLEVVEWLNVSNISVTSNATPGQNPCGCTENRDTLPIQRGNFTLVSSHNVTTEARSGSIPVALKISDLVDECASQGYLLDALAVLTCTVGC